MLQVAFPSVPAFLPANEDPTLYTDQDPWDFPDLKQVIANDIVAGLQAAPSQQALFHNFREFTILQRLFRVALEGKLGQRFPVERLINLTEATGGVAYERTPRWTPRPGLLEADFLDRIQLGVVLFQALRSRQLDAAQSGWLTRPLEALNGCNEMAKQALTPSGRPANLSTIPRQQWVEKCQLSAFESSLNEKCESSEYVNPKIKEIACGVRSLIIASEEVEFARELRAAMGVSKDELFQTATGQ